MRALKKSIPGFLAKLDRAAGKVGEAIQANEEEWRAAEVAPYSWDLSAQKGAEMRATELEELKDLIEAAASIVRELDDLIE